MQATVALADALEGRREQGVAAGRAAIEALRRVGVRFDAAEIAFGMARALQRDDPERAWFADFARDVFRDTATVLLPYLDDAPVNRSPRDGRSQGPEPRGLLTGAMRLHPNPPADDHGRRGGRRSSSRVPRSPGPSRR